MVWGCMNWEGAKELTKIKGNWNSDHYQNILHDILSMSVVNFGKEAEEWVLQQDNNPKHINKLTFEWFTDQAITILS